MNQVADRRGLRGCHLEKQFLWKLSGDHPEEMGASQAQVELRIGSGQLLATRKTQILLHFSCGRTFRIAWHNNTWADLLCYSPDVFFCFLFQFGFTIFIAAESYPSTTFRAL